MKNEIDKNNQSVMFKRYFKGIKANTNAFRQAVLLLFTEDWHKNSEKIAAKIQSFSEKMDSDVYRKCILATKSYINSADFTLSDKYEKTSYLWNAFQYVSESKALKNLNQKLDQLVQNIKKKTETWAETCENFYTKTASTLFSIFDYVKENPISTIAGLLYAQTVMAAAIFPVNLGLSSLLNGKNGFKLLGEAAGDDLGYSVSSAGDINGDSLPDLLVSAKSASANGQIQAGVTYVIFGGNDVSTKSLPLSSLDGTNGFKINGENAGDYSGVSVSSAGDVNDDGIDDLIIGANSAGPNGKVNAGSSYVIFGKSGAWTTSFNLSMLDGSNGFKINGENAFDYSGYSVSYAGDINHDGIDDVIIGAYGADPHAYGAGSNYILFGKSGEWVTPFELSNLNGINGFKINGENGGDYSGRSVSFAGDVNGDGIDDLIIGAYGADPNGKDRAGSSYVLFGKSGAWSTLFELSSIDGTNGFKINGENADDYSGVSVSSAGDVNDDGVSDLIIGANYAGPNGKDKAGSSYVLFGKIGAWTTPFELSMINGTNGFKINGENTGDYSGRSVSSAGDINGDGIDDLIVGAFWADPNGKDKAGSSYVIFGKSGAWATPFELSMINGINGIKFTGEVAEDFIGYSSSFAGDVNGDGIQDLIIGAYGADPDGKIDAGASYVIFGAVPINFTYELTTNQLVINESETRLITLSNFNAMSSIDDNLYFTSQNLKHGRFENINQLGQAIFDFSKQEIIDGQIQFVHDGSEFAPSYDVTVHAETIGSFGLNSHQASIFFTNVNDPAAIVTTKSPVSYVKNNPPTIIDKDILVTDIDSIASKNATVAITNNFVSIEDKLFFVNQNDITGIYDDAKGILTLTGNSTVAHYQSALRNVRYHNILNNPENSFRNISFTVYDGEDNSLTAFRLLNIVDQPNTTFPAVLELSDLNSLNGIKINGEFADDESGYSVSAAGDINGDGIDDLIIGAYKADPNGLSNAGSSYVLFGKKPLWSSVIELSTLDSITGFKINGENAGDLSGHSVSFAGDINGDGISDLIVGAFYADPDGKDRAGVSYIIFGKDSAWTTPFNLSSINGNNGFKIYGESANDKSGSSVSAAGDINGDGVDDLIIGAYTADPNGESYAGSSYVVFGKQGTWTTPFELSSIDGNNGFKINGEHDGDFSGYSVSAAGDINGDGVDDIIIGAYMADPNGESHAGSSYVVFGKVTWKNPFNLSAIDGNNGFKINGEIYGDESGYSVSSAGDINGDGIDDLIIGAYMAEPDGKSRAGSSYVLFGKNTTWTTPFELSMINGANGVKINGAEWDQSGVSVSYAGDINGDGIDDLIIGAYWAMLDGRAYAGSSFVLFGKQGIWTTPFELFMIDGINGFRVNGEKEDDSSGNAVSFAGDINGDGIDDLVIGTCLADPNGKSSAGSSYVIFGNNLPPKVMTSENALNYTENEPPKTIDSEIIVTDIDNANLMGGNVAIVKNFYSAEDQLMFDNQNGITGVYNNETGILNLTGTSSVANYQTALRSITYHNLGWSPSNATRMVAFIVNDGRKDSLSAAKDIEIILFHDAPVLINDGGSFDYTEHDPATVIDSSVTISHAETANLANATISITNNFHHPEDVLIFMDQNNIYGAYNETTGVLSLVGSSSVAHYQTALRSVEYENPSDAPHTNPRTIAFVVDDGVKTSNPVIRQINIISVNNPPVLTNSGVALNYTENDPATIVDSSIHVVDVDHNNLVGATVSITSNFDFLQDRLSFSNQNNIVGSYNSALGVLTLSGTSDVTNYQTALLSIKYINLSENPSTGDRTVSFIVRDGEASSTAITQVIHVISVRDPPVITLSGSTLKYIIADPATFIDPNLNILDLDSSELYWATVSIINNFNAAEDLLSFINQHGIVGSYNNETGVLSLTGASSVINYQVALRDVGYENSANSPTTDVRSIAFVVNDGVVSSHSAVRNITIIPENHSQTDDNFFDFGNSLFRTILLAVAGGVIGFLFLVLRICLYRNATKSFEKLTSIGDVSTTEQQKRFQTNVLRPIAQAIFDRIKITGCFGFISDNRMKDYLAAVTKLIVEIQQQGINVDLDNLSPVSQSLLINEIAKQSENVLLPRNGCCSCGACCLCLKKLCVAEVSPEIMEAQVVAIAIAVKNALKRNNYDVFLSRQSVGADNNQGQAKAYDLPIEMAVVGSGLFSKSGDASLPMSINHRSIEKPLGGVNFEYARMEDSQSKNLNAAAPKNKEYAIHLRQSPKMSSAKKPIYPHPPPRTNGSPKAKPPVFFQHRENKQQDIFRRGK